jgi:hypothetical protein
MQAKTRGFETGWLMNAGYDSLFIFGILALAVGSGLLVWFNPSLFVPVLLADLWLLGYHHVISTFTKLAGTAEDRKENAFLIYKLPFLVLAGVGALAYGIGIWSVVTIYFFWQWFHYTRQSYGISSFYRRKTTQAVAEHPYLSQAVVWCIPVWGLLNRCAQGWDSFLFLPVWLPSIPFWMPVIAGVAAVMIILYWAVLRFDAWMKGHLPLGQTLFLLSHMCAFYVGYILIDDINTGWLVANIWHNAQYILFVWLYNTNRFKGGYEKDKHKGGAWLAWASQPKPVRIFAYFAGCLILTSLFYGSVQGAFKLLIGPDAALLAVVYVIIFQTVNFHHYVVDGLIWKARHKKHQVVMDLKN